MYFLPPATTTTRGRNQSKEHAIANNNSKPTCNATDVDRLDAFVGDR